MKFWEKFLKNISKLAAQPQLKKVQPKLLEQVLALAPRMLDQELVDEIRSFIISQQTTEGGFADRGGKPDLYYTLFGYFVAESLSITEVQKPLKIYVQDIVSKGHLTGVYRYCGAILYAKLIGLDEVTEKLRREIVSELRDTKSKQPEYTRFLGILALYYLEDFLNIQRTIHQFKKTISLSGNHPCPVIAATTILIGMTGKKQPEAKNKIKSFYRPNGGFAALLNAPTEDLLSTAVSLYALYFLDTDIRMIKPDCLIFVDDLYDKGGFRSTFSDTMTDVEYTFYGLLALGSMS
jgi:hypothetical protein